MIAQPCRLAVGGRIDRATAFTLRFNGRDIAAYAGDTLASALLANGVRVVGRSFKYHRPRGVFSAGVEEPNALVQLRQGGRGEPNSRATTVEAFPGLEAASQGGWPSVDFDIGAVLGAFSRFMPAGFYYKTFIGPGRGTAWWMFCERFIRRGAGGRAGDPGRTGPRARRRAARPARRRARRCLARRRARRTAGDGEPAHPHPHHRLRRL